MQKLILQISDTDIGNASLMRELSCLKVYLRDPLSSLIPINRLQLYHSLRLDRGIWRDLLVISSLGIHILLPFYHQPRKSSNYALKNIDIDYGFSVRQSFLNEVLEKIDIGGHKNRKKIIQGSDVRAINREVLPNCLPVSSEVINGRKEIKKLFLHVFKKTLTRLGALSIIFTMLNLLGANLF